MQLTKAFVKAWLDQQHLCNSNFYHLLFRRDIKHLAIVLIFNFSFSIKHLFGLTVRHCHAFTNASTLAVIVTDDIATIWKTINDRQY
jgi:hypothetical protein